MVNHQQLKYEPVFKVLKNIFPKKKLCEHPNTLHLIFLPLAIKSKKSP